jgi:hypothetical protein
VHPLGTPILPSSRSRRARPTRPARAARRRVPLQRRPDHLGWPARVHRAHTPAPRSGTTGWLQADPTRYAAPTRAQAELLVPQRPTSRRTRTSRSRRPPAAPERRPGAARHGSETAHAPHVLPFGRDAADRRPRRVRRRLRREPDEPIPNSTVDEIVFGDAQFGASRPATPTRSRAEPDRVERGREQSTDLQVQRARSASRAARWRSRTSSSPSSRRTVAPEDRRRDRRLLQPGSRVGPHLARDRRARDARHAAAVHHVSEPVTLLEHRPVSMLAAGSPRRLDAPAREREDFPSEGTVLVDRSSSTTRACATTRSRCRDSRVAGCDGREGRRALPRALRNDAAAHVGRAVILFPFRYWDRWQPRADAPELAYFTLSSTSRAPGGSRSSSTRRTRSARLGVLARFDPEAPGTPIRRTIRACGSSGGGTRRARRSRSEAIRPRRLARLRAYDPAPSIRRPAWRTDGGRRRS